MKEKVTDKYTAIKPGGGNGNNLVKQPRIFKTTFLFDHGITKTPLNFNRQHVKLVL